MGLGRGRQQGNGAPIVEGIDVEHAAGCQAVVGAVGERAWLGQHQQAQHRMRDQPAMRAGLACVSILKAIRYGM